MPVVTFWSNGKEQTGKTLSMVAIATFMAIEHNMKILLVSTAKDDTTLYNCYFERQRKRQQGFGMFAPKQSRVAIDNGMSGLIKIARSNKITPETIRNYTKVVFKDVLEILFSGSTAGNNENMSKYYPDIIKAAANYYDMVLVDLDNDIDEDIQTQILENSNVVLANINQKLSSVDNFTEIRKQSEILASNKTLIVIGRYDKFSRYSSKNITRYLGEKSQVLAIPYNTLFFDSAEEAGVPDFFLNFAKNKNLDREDRNYIFFQETKRTVDAILYRIQELQMRM